MISISAGMPHYQFTLTKLQRTILHANVFTLTPYLDGKSGNF